MCGIAGVMSKNGDPPRQAVLDRLAGALAHRGPDGHGFYRCDGVGLVHTRLAIIDLVTGDQPLYARRSDDARPTALIANGEIYNDLDLRAKLGQRRFATGSDCESPLHLYLHHGETFADHLRGMFAIALHDPGRGPQDGGRLVLARDPFGIKPLYVAETPTAFAFASEPQALIAAGIVPAALNAAARDELLQLQFTTGRSTAFIGVERLLPGETLVIEQGRIVRRHVRQALPSGPPCDTTESAALAALDAILIDSVGLHQRSDAPYGMFLSGGIDSSVVLTVMGQLNERPVVALTAGFASNAGVHDERTEARALAQAVGAEHVEVAVGEQDFWRLMPLLATCMDDPAADYATLPSFQLAATARQMGIKVVLTGEGGDEMFAGYGRYRRAMRPRLLGGRAMRTHGAFDGMRVLRQEARWRGGLRHAQVAADHPERTRLQVAQAVDCAEWLPNDLLLKLDRCLMAHGIEGRVPFVDPVTAAFAFRLPDRLKVGGGLGKLLLRRWLERNQPNARPFARKRGFTVPVAAWIAGRARDLAPLLAAQDSVREACHPGSVERLLDAAANGNARAGRAAWNLLFYALWHRRHIAGLQPEADVFATLAP